VAGGSFADAALGAGSRIGRYFGLVSAVPSALFVLFVYSLAKSGAWTGHPDWQRATKAIEHISLGEFSFLLVLTLGLGLLLHPLQFAFTQALEGYWGGSQIPSELALHFTLRHHRRWRTLDDRKVDNQDAAETASYRDAVRARLGLETALRALQGYPTDPDRIMPTRLGNMLRRHEDRAGRIHGLSALTIHPYLVIAGDSGHIAILHDARQQMDIAIRLCGLSALAALVATGFLLTDGLWLLIALIPYLGAYVCYRGAVAAAANWGSALSTIIDLDRFALYEQLRLELPTDTGAEVRQNVTLMQVLRDRRPEKLPLAHSPATAANLAPATGEDVEPHAPA
jgi:hypothetical protein